MALNTVAPPYPVFTDRDGTPLEDGYVYIGESNRNPEVNPIQVFWDAELTIPVAQPIRTVYGYLSRNGTPAQLYANSTFSLTVKNSKFETVFTAPSNLTTDSATNARIEVETFTGDGTTTQFTLVTPPVSENNTQVFINGVYQSKSTYSLAGAVLTFSEAPPAVNSGIEVVSLESFAIGSVDSSFVSYQPAGGIERTVQAKLRETVSVKDFGAVGDGVTDDTAAIQAALDTGKSVFVPDGEFYFTSALTIFANGQSVFGNGAKSILKHRDPVTPGSSPFSTNGADDVNLFNFQLDGGTGGTRSNIGIWVLSGSNNVSIDNVFFNGGNQVVYLQNCSNVKVVNCTFANTGYGVIQKFGTVSSHVLIDGNTCFNSDKDFVEANCDFTAPSENWVISNNTYDTNSNYPTVITEGRFVGITAVRGTVITGNVVKGAAGDSAVHLEDALGDTVVSNNVFDNCLVTGGGGNKGYIFLLATSEHTVISNNIFTRTDATLPEAWAVDTSSNAFANALVISDNIVRGEAPAGNMNGVRLGFQNSSSTTTCVGNVFQDLDVGIEFASANNAVVSANSFNRCEEPILTRATTSVLDSVISDNNFIGTTGTHDISSPTTTRVSVQDNQFVKAVNLGTCTDVFVNNNIFGASASLVALSGTRAYSPANVFQSPQFLQARYPSGIGSQWQVSTSKRALNAGGSATATFRVTCTANNTSWSPGTIKIEAAACDTNGAEFTAAWWAYKFRVLGSNTNTNEAVEDSGGTTASYSITFTNVSASATEVVFDVAVTATNADQVAVNLSNTYYFGAVSVV